jgi:hypothetical protein
MRRAGVQTNRETLNQSLKWSEMVLGFAPEARNCLKDLVAGDCNAPNALTLPFRLELTANC